MAPQYKLRYFNITGLAEPIRWMFAYAKVDYEDIRLDKADWPQIKTTMPWGQVPILEIEGGEVIAQSFAIGRYLARQFGLMGETEIEGAKCDEYLEAMKDIQIDVRPYIREEDEVKKEQLKKEFEAGPLEAYYQRFTNILNKTGSGYLIGNKMSYADIYLAYSVEQLNLRVNPDVVEKFPVVKKHYDFVKGQPAIKEWLAKRPQ